MADPTMPLNSSETASREWIGAFDGMLLGFEKNRFARWPDILVARRRLIQFFWAHRRIGLKALGNRIAQILPEQIDQRQLPSYFTFNGSLPNRIRRFLQDHRNAVKKARLTEQGCSVDRNCRPVVNWPKVPTEWDDVSPADYPLMEDLHTFTSDCLQNTPSEAWITPTTANASFLDKKWPHHLISTFWSTCWDYPNWLSSPDIWDARVEFGLIIGEAINQPDGFDFPDGITAMDPQNPYYDAPADEALGLQVGVHSKFNRHILASKAITLRNDQMSSVSNIVKLAKSFGTIDGPDNEPSMPPRLYKKLTSFLHVRELQHVGFHRSDISHSGIC
jgi:hypothetical protein